MVQEAEQFKAEDEIQRDKVTAKNSLESLAFNMKSTVEDEKLQDKISPEDRKTIVDKCNEVIAWLDKNQVCIFVMRVYERQKFLIDSHCESRDALCSHSANNLFTSFSCRFYIVRNYDIQQPT